MKIGDNFVWSGVMECYRGNKLYFTPILGQLKGSLLGLNDTTKVQIFTAECKEISFKER